MQVRLALNGNVEDAIVKSNQGLTKEDIKFEASQINLTFVPPATSGMNVEYVSINNPSVVILRNASLRTSARAVCT